MGAVEVLPLFEDRREAAFQPGDLVTMGDNTGHDQVTPPAMPPMWRYDGVVNDLGRNQFGPDGLQDPEDG